MPKQLNQWLDEFVENGADASNVTDWPEEAGGGSPIEEGTGIKITGEDTKTISIDEEVVAKKEDIGNGRISITIGGTTKGFFDLNQKNNKTIDLGAESQGELTLYVIHYEKDNIKFTLQGLANCTNTYGSDGYYGDALTELDMCLGQSENNEFYLVDITGASGSGESYLYEAEGGVYIHHNNNNYLWIYDTCTETAYGWATYLRINDFPNHS